MLEDALTNGHCRMEADIEESSAKVGQSKDTHSFKVDDMVGLSKQTSVESDDTVPEKTNATTIEEPSGVGGNCCEVELAEGSNSVIEDERNVHSELKHQGPATSASSHCLDDHNSKECSSSATIGHSKQCHSTLGDPNFVENYFKVVKLEEFCILILHGEW